MAEPDLVRAMLPVMMPTLLVRVPPKLWAVVVFRVRVLWVAELLVSSLAFQSRLASVPAEVTASPASS